MSEQVMIPNQIQIVLNALMKVSVDYNAAVNPDYYGVLFFKHPQSGLITATAVSSQFAVIVEGLKEEPQGEFYSFIENAWVENKYAINADKIIQTFERLTPQHSGKIIFPFSNLINHINELTDKEKNMTRAIIAPDIVEDGEILMKFENNGERVFFQHRLLPKPCFVAPNSKIPEQFIKPNLVYKAVLATNEAGDIIEDENGLYVNVLGQYSKIKLGLHFSQNGFIPNDMDSINKMVEIPESRIFRINAIEPVENFKMAAIHLNCMMLYDLIKCMALSSSSFMETYVSEDPNTPIVMRNIKSSPDDLQITIMQATLNPYYGAQRR